MKFFRLVLACVVLFGMSGVANAYRINVLDPTGFNVTPITDASVGINVSFTACDPGQLPYGTANPSSYGCYSASNATGSTINSLELIFSQSGAFASGLDCTQNAAFAAELLFTSVACSVSGGNVTFDFSGGNGIPSSRSSFFTIVVEDVPTQQLSTIPQGTLTGTVVSETPEPGSLALLSTGLASLTGVVARKRRWFSAN